MLSRGKRASQQREPFCGMIGHDRRLDAPGAGDPIVRTAGNDRDTWAIRRSER